MRTISKVKILAAILSLAMLVSLVPASLMTSAATAAEPVVLYNWQTATDAGTWAHVYQPAGGTTTTNPSIFGAGNRIDLFLNTTYGTAAVQTPVTPGLDGSKYDKIKLIIGCFGSASFTAYVAFGGSTIDNTAYRKEFTVDYVNNVGEIILDMSDMETWTNNKNIDYLRIGLDIGANAWNTSNRLLLDYVEICPVTANEDVVWDFVKDGQGSWAAFWGTSQTTLFDTTNSRFDITSQHYGTIGVQTPIAPVIDGSKYEKIRLHVCGTGNAAFTAYLAFGGSTIDNPAYQKSFAVNYVGDLGWVEVDMSDMATWTTNQGIDYLRIALNVEQNIANGAWAPGNRLIIDRIEITAAADPQAAIVKDAIANLPAADAVTPADVAAIDAACAAYDSLSWKQKLDVDNDANLDALRAAADAFRPALQGAQYRAIGGGNGDGVRFGATVTGKAADAYKGYTLAGYGFVYGKAEKWNGGALTRESSFAKYQEGTAMLPADGAELTFYGSIVNITEALADVALMGRAYLIYEKDGQKVYVYSTENSDMNGAATESMAWIRSLNKTIELANAG